MDINQSSNNYAKLLSMLGQDASTPSKTLLTQATGDTQANKSNSNKNVVDYSDRVSLSYRAEKLHRISSEFFSGTINSAQIPELAKRLYEDGFLSTSDYQKLGGQTQKVSAISQAASFVNRLILNEDVDAETVKSLKNVASAIANMNVTSTPELRQAEVDAFEFISVQVEKMQEAGASKESLSGFHNVLDVLSALDKVRKQEHNTGALTSYASVQDAYDQLFTDK